MGRKVSDNITDAELKSTVDAARQRIVAGSAKAPVKITVGQGAQLWVMDADEQKGCYWRLPYRFHGKQKVLALGTCTITSTKAGKKVLDGITLSQARELAIKARAEIAAGNDPTEQRQVEKRQQRMQAENSFAAIAREWFAQQTDSWTDGHSEEVFKTLEREAFPAFGDKPIASIKPLEVLAMLRNIEKRGAMEVAGRVRQRVGAVFRYAIMTERAESNPAAELAGAMKKRKIEPRPALPLADLPRFLKMLDENDMGLLPTTRAAMGFIILTFARPGEVRFARWSEFDLEKGVWSIPAERMKMKRPHRVPLSEQALTILRDLHPLTGRYDLVFPSDRDHSKPISENTMGYAINRMGWHRRATAHGFRAVALTILNETGRFHADAIERQLAHTDDDEIRAAYHRAEYWDERVKMMQWYANYVDRLKAGNVITATFGKTA